jgi:hypothetical protein
LIAQCCGISVRRRKVLFFSEVKQYMGQSNTFLRLKIMQASVASHAGLYADLPYKEYMCAYVEKCKHTQI